MNKILGIIGESRLGIHDSSRAGIDRATRQAGLVMGYHLSQRGLRFTILDRGAQKGYLKVSGFWPGLQGLSHFPSLVEEPCGALFSS